MCHTAGVAPNREKTPKSRGAQELKRKTLERMQRRHLRIAIRLDRKFIPSDRFSRKALVEEVKTESSKWIKTKGPEFRNFHWQSGYGAFSIGQSQLAAVKRYIQSQKEHHRRVTFQEEFRKFLKRYEISTMSATCGTELFRAFSARCLNGRNLGVWPRL